ncbi:hypothetical protein XNC1_0394 [Xenorhabdus nematophila ATCC 19061]|uniref:Uncharacterized protein n=1 Tax=Xenorhabdus nematophila (strain ATCC 19061 / DSM 3370 / CCUG 14189 / LMG 1036 / NCIMB 9965 / AN6) TaxID=406817 RepID=D3VHY2_XENNA|nr:hypothetical protein XNC1_0394 [Xenorhabdus nematophila ATCC 19061]CEK21385.1 hypothetical protein XNC2_0386 [Xenorhabdus nematophila AN6/1]
MIKRRLPFLTPILLRGGKLPYRLHLESINDLGTIQWVTCRLRDLIGLHPDFDVSGVSACPL